jgi:hypothetical protein
MVRSLFGGTGSMMPINRSSISSLAERSSFLREEDRRQS